MLNASVIPSRASDKTKALSVEQRCIQWKKYRKKETKNKTTNMKTKPKSEGWLRMGRLERIVNRKIVKK